MEIGFFTTAGELNYLKIKPFKNDMHVFTLTVFVYNKGIHLKSRPYVFKHRRNGFELTAEQEQGRVESLVGYMRRNYFVPVPKVKSFGELNLMLLERLHEDDRRPVHGKEISIGEAWEQGKC